jgi:recombination protein RecT
VLVAQFQLGYKGLIDLAYRSGEVEVVQSHVVYENDTFECEYGLDPKLTHVPADKDRGEPIKVYAVFKTKSGGYGFEVMSMEDVRLHASKYSKTYGSSFSPWKTNFEEMAKKTVLKKVLKYAPLKSDFVRGISQDGSIKNEISEDMYSVPSETVYEADFVDVDTDTGEVMENEN